MVEAPGFRKLVTSLYPDGDPFLATDAVFGVKKDLVVVSFITLLPSLYFILTGIPQKLEEVNDDAEARKRGFPKGGSFKLLKYDITLVPLDQAKAAFEEFAKLRAKNASAQGVYRYIDIYFVLLGISNCTSMNSETVYKGSSNPTFKYMS